MVIPKGFDLDIVVEVELEAKRSVEFAACMSEERPGSDPDVFYAIAVVNDVAHYVFFHTGLIEHLLSSASSTYIYVYNCREEKNGVRRISYSLRTLEGAEDHRQ